MVPQYSGDDHLCCGAKHISKVIIPISLIPLDWESNFRQNKSNLNLIPNLKIKY